VHLRTRGDRGQTGTMHFRACGETREALGQRLRKKKQKWKVRRDPMTTRYQRVHSAGLTPFPPPRSDPAKDHGLAPVIRIKGVLVGRVIGFGNWPTEGQLHSCRKSIQTLSFLISPS
jgi:hypothetical protein